MFNAFRVVLAEQAMAEAAEVERRLAAGELLTLAGVPAAVKSDTDVAGVSSMCGTRDRMVERFVDLLGMRVHTFSGVRDQVRECVEKPWPRRSLGAHGGARLFGISGSGPFDSQLDTRPITSVVAVPRPCTAS